MTPADERTRVLAELERVKSVLESLIVWMAQSANSPISMREAGMLLDKLAAKERRGSARCRTTC